MALSRLVWWNFKKTAPTHGWAGAVVARCIVKPGHPEKA